jgi:choline dehydrogenase-like flavoprotein
MGMTCVEQAMRIKLTSAFGGERLLTNGRAAIITQRHNGRAACHYCGKCEAGCITRSYFSSNSVTLPAAAATGKMTLRPHSVVESVLYDAKSGKARGVRVVDATTKEVLEFEGRVVFLCASALETVRLLLNSKSTRWRDGLANSSGTLGKYVMDHTAPGGAEGVFEGFEDKTTVGRRPNGVYLPRFSNVTSRHPDFVRGFGYQGYSAREGWSRGEQMDGFGADFKRQLIKDEGRWRFQFYGFGECLPREDNFVRLDPEKKDRWGIPALQVNVTYGPNEIAQAKEIGVRAVETLEAAGATEIRNTARLNVPGLCIHEVGGARMSRTAQEGVVNQWNQAWDVPNLFITDGSFMASSANQNPSITYMAFTARAVDHVVTLMKQNAL